MTIYSIFGNSVTDDGEISSTSTTYTSARNGSNLDQENNDGVAFVGQYKTGATYRCLQMFMEFTLTSIASTELVTGSYIQLYSRSAVGSTTRGIEIRGYDFGTLTTADWRTPTQFAALDFYSDIDNVHKAPTNLTGVRGGSRALRDRVKGSNPLRVVAATDRWRAGNAPTGDEYNRISSATTSGTTQDPCLVVKTIRQSSMVAVGGQGAVQLSDGSHVYLESDGDDNADDILEPAVTLKRDNAGSVSTIATILSGSITMPNSLQAMAVTRDQSDNIYVVWSQEQDQLTIRAKAFLKSGSTWTAKTTLTGSLPAYTNSASTQQNNVIANWVSTTGAGLLTTQWSRMAWTGETGLYVSATLSCTALLAGSGTLIVNTTLDPAYVTKTANAELVAYPNETGTGMDYVGKTFGSRDIAGVTYDSNNTAKNIAYIVANSGTTGIYTPNLFGGEQTPVVRDPNSKLRILPLDSARVAIIGAGGKVVFKGWNGAVYGTVSLPDEDITDILTASQFNTRITWDAVYDAAGRKVWVYWLDPADSRRLLRTSIDATTYLADVNQEELSTTIGSSGTSNVAVRVPRGPINERRVQVAIANVAAGEVFSTVYFYDSYNVAPTAPTLSARSNFDADGAATFAWTFNDINTTDDQTAYELEIIRVSDAVTVVDTGKTTSTSKSYSLTASTLDNDEDYQWRVRTWDKADAEGAWSGYASFSTSAAGTVTITDPVADNIAGIETADYTVTWTFSAPSGETQQSRQVVLVRTSDEVTVFDSTMQASTDTEYVISGMESNTEYRIEVTVLDTNAVTSNTAERLITPIFDAVNTPSFSVTPRPTLGYMEIATVNPDPTGDRPAPTENLIYRRIEGLTAWTLLGSVEPDAAYKDYTAASGITYEYFVRASDGAAGTSDSATMSGVLNLMGVWIHDVNNADDTIHAFPYGTANNTFANSIVRNRLEFAGRRYPVYDTGQQRMEGLTVSTTVARGTISKLGITSTYESDLAAMQAAAFSPAIYCVRDARGRKVFGPIENYDESDEAWGTVAKFSVQQNDYEDGTLSDTTQRQSTVYQYVEFDDVERTEVYDSQGRLAVFTVGSRCVSIRRSARTFTEQKKTFTDSFDRNRSNGWGPTPGGGNWNNFGTPPSSSYSTDGDAHILAGLNKGSSHYMRVNDTLLTFDITTEFDFSDAPATASSSYSFSAVGHWTASTDHMRARLTFNTGNTVVLSISEQTAGTDTVKVTAGTIASDYAVGQNWKIRFASDGLGTYNAKAWKAADPEPGSWTITYTYSGTIPHPQGDVGVRALVASGESTTPTVNVYSFALNSGTWPTPPVVQHQQWIRLLDTPFDGQVDETWLNAEILSSTTDDEVLATAMRYITGGDRDADYGAIYNIGHTVGDGHAADGTRKEGSDWNDYRGVTGDYPDLVVPTTDAAEAYELGCLDCSGYVREVFGYNLGMPMCLSSSADFNGFNIPRITVDQFESGPGVFVFQNEDVEQVTAEQLALLLPGDVLFFDATADPDEEEGQIDHSGIYLGVDSNGEHRFLSSRKTPSGPTFGDTGGASVVGRLTGLYSLTLRGARRF